LRAASDQGVTIEELTGRHQRNENAIRARLLRLGVIEDDRTE
jgi:Fe2+ transport system protein FeoA